MAKRDLHQLTAKIQVNQDVKKPIIAAHDLKLCALTWQKLAYFPKHPLLSTPGKRHNVPFRPQRSHHTLHLELIFLLPAHWMVYRPFLLVVRKFETLQRFYCKVLIRGRHSGQGPRDPAVPLPEILDRDSNSKCAGFGTVTGTEIWKIRDPGLGPGRI